eukprot:sb/3472811/
MSTEVVAPNNLDARLARENQPPPDTRERIEAEYEDEEDVETLKYGAKHVMMLIVPVSVCMMLVIAIIRTVTMYDQGPQQQVYLVYTPFNENNKDISTGSPVSDAVLNMLIVVSLVVVMTCFLVLLYKYRCYKIIYGWLFLSSLILLFMFSFIYLQEVCVN